jgi:alpha-glucuronidase
VTRALLFLLIFSVPLALQGEDGYRLWLRYDLISNVQLRSNYKQVAQRWKVDGNSATLAAARNELKSGIEGLLGEGTNEVSDNFTLLASNSGSASISQLKLSAKIPANAEGFLITMAMRGSQKIIVITSSSDVGVLYGIFHFLRLLQTGQDVSNVSVTSEPLIKLRLLNHWDNLDRTVERGYAGNSIWDWHKLPEYKDPRYTDYARANASIGINGAVVTNVNANALILTPAYLAKFAALADILRPYGIKIFLTARFSAPIEIGKLKTADPLDPEVKAWWKARAGDIYKLIPDFGGFLVKANSEGQPGPQTYNRTHADGANMLADAVASYGGIVIWRAFVYDDKNQDDRAKQAFTEFKPLDGSFRDNVLVQVKNGAIDFQPREPFHPLFGAMPKTPLTAEFQITQEYLGFSTHLVYLATLFKECLQSDTWAKGKGSTVAKVIDGTLDAHRLSGMSGVANIGTDRNWCGHPFGQANWYSFGRLAWDHDLTAEQIAEEWIRMTFSNDPALIAKIKSIMLSSRETTVSYMTPLGLHHIMGWSHHYGPAPWIKDKPRFDWTSVYYHRADSLGVGFNRTATGSNAVGQYAPAVQSEFSSPDRCPEKYLLWFHHMSWNYKMKSGATLWNALCGKYYSGVDSVRWMQRTWSSLEGKVDADRFNQVRMLLSIQEKEAVWWRNACLLYFQKFSRQPIPENFEKPDQTLEYYQKLEFPYAPGINPRW